MRYYLFSTFTAFILAGYEVLMVGSLSPSRPMVASATFLRPNCPQYKVTTSSTLGNGQLLEGLLPAGYCKSEDTAMPGASSEGLRRILSGLREPDLQSVFVAAFSFSSEALMDELEKVASRGIPVTGVVNQSSERMFLDPATKRAEEKGSPFSIRTWIPQKGLRGIMHLKLWILTYPTYKLIIFGSANPSTRGMNYNFENLTFVRADPNDTFSLKHECLAKNLYEGASNKNFDWLGLDRCISHNAENNGDYSLIITPHQANDLARLIDLQASNSSYIDMTASFFLTYHPLIKTLQKASVRGTHLRALFDDDALYGADILAATAKNIQNLEKNTHFESRFIFTNLKARNLFHHKFIIFYSKDHEPEAVLTGAGHFSNTAMNKSLENFVWITDKQVVLQFQREFSSLWDNQGRSRDNFPVALLDETTVSRAN